jgi:hypothetical protein
VDLNLDYTDPEVSGNWFEAVFWWGLAGTLAWRANGPGAVIARRVAWILVPFGLSDLVESQTGAWWRPWWLLAWKAACVVALLACGLAYRRLQQAGQRDLDAGQDRGQDRGDRDR